MIQFTTEEIEAFRLRADKDRIVGLLKERTEKLLSHDISDIPSHALANWSHYYYCPDCSVPLVFDENEKAEHLCPSCGKVFKGEPFDGAWYRLLNDFYTRGAYHLALLNLLTCSDVYAKKAIAILLAFAKYYPSYKPHGDIPYNNPGKANAQTLDESFFLKYLAFSYDILQDAMSESEKSFIKQNLFREGMDFLIKNRMAEIHNHEVISNSAIAILALILEDRKALDLALNGKYGLLYQLNNGVLEDGYWFECSTAYHFYAIEAFFNYEKFAIHTDYSNIENPIYKKMFDVVFHYLREDISFTRLNDTKFEQGQIGAYEVFEFAYRAMKDERILALLHKAYETKERLSIESFFYGVESLPPVKDSFMFEDYYSKGGLGCSVLRGKKHEFLLFRHGKYGGEHDHYDRLSISYNYLDDGVSEDFGTCGYGAPFHYSYFKNTGTHNTVVIDEENQAPSEGKLEAVEKCGTEVDITASCSWEPGYEMPDSLTIKEWSDEAYLGVRMKRRIIKTDDYLIDVFLVAGVVPGRSIDFVMHFGGELTNESVGVPVKGIFRKKPLNLLKEVGRLEKGRGNVCKFTTAKTDSVYFGMNNGNDVYVARGYDNPTSRDCVFYVERAYGPKALFVHLLHTKPKGKTTIRDVCFSLIGTRLSVTVDIGGKKRTHVINIQC